MRSEILLKLISAHYDNDTAEFEVIVNKLIEEEKKKGNHNISESISSLVARDKQRPSATNKKKGYGPSSGLVLFEPTNLISPKEKSNNFDLFDLVNPEEISDAIVLSTPIRKKIDEIILEFRQRDKLVKMGLPFENRLLLCGPPGCGKTSTARLIAHELGLQLANVRLDSLMSSFLGQTGTNIRKIFEAVNGKEVVLFLDEFDAIAKQRDDKQELGELKRVVNTLLQNIDNLSNDVFVIAATNHENLLDPAVWRRFNTVLYLDFPDNKMRSQYLRQRLNEHELHENVDVDKVAEATSGLNFSQLNEIVYKTIKKAIFHDSKKIISTDDFLISIFEVLNLFRMTKNTLDRKSIQRLRKSGLKVTTMSELLNIPRATLYDWLNKEEKNDGEKE